MENEESSSLIGNSAAPYINGLAQSYGLATQYYAISHPSLPNYLAMTAGSTFGISSDCTTCWVGATNLADQIEAGGRSWKAYLEGMPSACFVGDAYPYMQKHNPWIYYNDIRCTTVQSPRAIAGSEVRFPPSSTRRRTATAACWSSRGMKGAAMPDAARMPPVGASPQS